MKKAKTVNEFLKRLVLKSNEQLRNESLINKLFFEELLSLRKLGLPDEWLLNEIAFMTEWFCRETGNFELHQALNLYEFNTVPDVEESDLAV